MFQPFHSWGIPRGTGTACAPMLTAASFTTEKKWEHPTCPLTDEWINKMQYIHTMEHYLDFRRKKILIHATTWMNLKPLCKIS